MVAKAPLPESHHVLRYVSASKRFVDDRGTRLGPSPAGFALRDGDLGGLSVTEVEYYGPMTQRTRVVAATVYRESLNSKKLGAQAIFAWAQVGDIKKGALTYNKKVRVVHVPVDGNPGHAEIRHFSDDDLELLDFFATEVFKCYEIVAEMAFD